MLCTPTLYSSSWGCAPVCLIFSAAMMNQSPCQAEVSKASHTNPAASDPLKCLPPGSEESSLSKALRLGLRPKRVPPNLAPSPSLPGTTDVGECWKVLLSLTLALYFLLMAFQSKWDNDGLCRANSESGSHQGTMWDSFARRRIVWSREMSRQGRSPRGDWRRPFKRESCDKYAELGCQICSEAKY